MQEKPKMKKNLSLNVVSKKHEHRGFGAGMIDLSQLSSVIIDEGDAYIDIGAIHGKSRIEKRIRFSTDPDDVPNGRRCWVIWVAVDRNEEGTYYAGVTACPMKIDDDARRGWKILAHHVNNMDKALKRHIILEGLNDQEKEALKKVLIENNEEMWSRSSELQTHLS